MPLQNGIREPRELKENQRQANGARTTTVYENSLYNSNRKNSIIQYLKAKADTSAARAFRGKGKMKFELYTKAEAKKVDDLISQISIATNAIDIEDLTLEEYSDQAKNDPEYIQMTEKIEKITTELTKINQKAYTRFFNQISKDKDSFFKSIEKMLTFYDAIGITLINDIEQELYFKEMAAHEKRFFIHSRLSASIADFVNFPSFTHLYLSDQSQVVKDILTNANALINEKAYKIEALYKQLNESGKIESYLKEHGIEGKKRNLPKVTVTRKGVENIDFPLDKINSKIFNTFNDLPKTGQISFRMEPNGRKTPATVLYSIDFDELEKTGDIKITRELTPFDKRCYLAAASLFRAGFPIVTVQQIYNAMGYTGRAGSDNIKKINDSLTKMMFAHIYINNTNEADVLKGYDCFVYDGYLLPIERIGAEVNGQIVESAIHIFREPPLIEFARGRKQITTINHKVLESPINKNNHTIQLEHYLITRISRMKKSKGKSSNKMLYKTILDNAGFLERKQRTRGINYTKRILEHQKNTGFIKDFHEEPDGIKIKY